MTAKRGSLWKAIIYTHYAELLFQTAWGMMQSALQFAPQLAMYHLLRLLEQRARGATVKNTAWGLVIALGAAIILASWSQEWNHWINWARLGQPIRTELSAMVFSKSLRRKDVKSLGKAKKTQAPELDGTPLHINGSGGISQTDPLLEAEANDSTDHIPKDGLQTDEDDDVHKTRQSTINLVGVDAARIADFATFYTAFPEAATELVVSITFLVILIGWQSLLAGLAVFAILLPINTYVSKRYTDSQDELMEIRDQKLAVMTEALQGIRQIKFSAEEQQWQDKIGKKRDRELKTLWRVFCLDSALIGVWILGPVMLSAVSLAVYAVLNGSLSPSVAFTTLTVMDAMEATLAILPELISDGLEAWVSVKRIDDYLQAPERDNYRTGGNYISFSGADIAWPADSPAEDADRFRLRDINIRFPMKELSVISGETGSGKSLLLAAILGEAEKLSGSIQVPQSIPASDRYDHKANKSDWIIESAIAFVAQIPWIENASIKQNVLFSLPYDAGRYRKVIRCCALEKDLEMLPDGDQTDIGANGINLSGGQKWRITFGRALYSRAGILVLDDIFSAVDAHVGRQLFEEALTGELGESRTRILVTHHFGLCMPKTKYTVILGEGTVQHAGTVEDLQITRVLEQIAKQEQSDQKEDEKIGAQALDEHANGTLHKILSQATERSQKLDDGELDIQGKSQAKKFTEDEKREQGSIKFGVYWEYLVACGGLWFWVPIMCLYLAYEGITVGRSWFVGYWTRSYATDESESALVQQSIHYLKASMGNQNPQTQDVDHDLSFYLSVYVGLSILICVFGTLRYFFVFMGAIRASKTLFENLTFAVLRAPLRWLDVTPVGRILNRFTADFNAIDSRLGNHFAFLLYQGVLLVGIIAAGLFVSPWMLLIAVVLLLFCTLITRSFLAGAREVKRLESTAKSPIFEQFGSVLAGIGTIRAFDSADAYLERMFEKIDRHCSAYWHVWLFNRWLSFRLNLMGAFFAILVAAVIVYSGIDASLAGFALSFALQYSSAVTWTARNYANVELAMNAVERVKEYSNNPIEDQSASINVPAAWPTEGRIEVSNLVAGYAPELPPVLKGLSFAVEKNQRVGVVGRTGAGKSSLTLALFRFLEAREGTIHIDGVDVSRISLHALRSRLAIIPQDPVLFSGTIRSNLDPFNNHTNAELYEALERVHLIRSTGLTSRDELNTSTPASRPASSGATTPATPNTNTNIFRSLTSRISEGGLNLSQGQRQLLCLARAIVSRPKIMLLDEATSAVDMATDALIQRSIREEFQDSTLVVIAHRLSTIADFDRILVMEDGRAVEFDTPRELMGRVGGVFRGMVEQSGEVGELREIIEGTENEARKGKRKER
ncbi:hypothetical protein ACLMJK_006199 [Lecanora helva]